MTIDRDQHAREVRSGERFEFGKNWAHFLAVLDEDRIALAETSLRSMLKLDRLDGRTFLDVGSGSGLFSLAAHRLGAKVHSFDYDPQSVACTRELKRRYGADDGAWTIERGSVLDRAWLETLGTFDIVYSWGVLHHTGRMWEAIDNVKPLVKLGGLLFIAIYNDQGEITDRWAEIKRRYNSLPRPLAALFALGIIAREEGRSLRGYLRGGDIKPWVQSWTGYARQSTRGMSKWHDWIDWVGGYPYERASIEAIADGLAKDGFRLTNLVDRSNGTGCNEFVFRCEAPLGTLVDFPLPGGRSFARRFGRRIVGPFERRDGTWSGRIAYPPEVPDGGCLLLFRNGAFVGTVENKDGGRVDVAPASDRDSVETDAFHVVAGFVRAPPDSSFRNEHGHIWSWHVPDLAPLADNAGKGDQSSPVCLFENGVQLPMPHALHDEIARVGRGRFSHWGEMVYFSSLTNANPNQDRGRFRLIVAVAPSKKSNAA